MTSRSRFSFVGVLIATLVALVPASGAHATYAKYKSIPDGARDIPPSAPAEVWNYANIKSFSVYSSGSMRGSASVQVNVNRASTSHPVKYVVTGTVKWRKTPTGTVLSTPVSFTYWNGTGKCRSARVFAAYCAGSSQAHTITLQIPAKFPKGRLVKVSLKGSLKRVGTDITDPTDVLTLKLW